MRRDGNGEDIEQGARGLAMEQYSGAIGEEGIDVCGLDVEGVGHLVVRCFCKSAAVSKEHS